MSHRRHIDIGVFFFDEDGTEYEWTGRAVDGGFSSLEESMEEDVLEFVHSDITITLDDADGAVSALLMALLPTSKWRVEIRRDPSSWVLLWAGHVDPKEVEQDFGEKTVSLKAYSYSKLLELTDATPVKRTVTGVTGTAVATQTTLSVSDASLLEIDDEITLQTGTLKETKRIAAKNANVLGVTEPWDNSFTSASLTLDTPYYRNKTAAFLATELFHASGITNVHTRPDTLAIDDPFPARMNSYGLNRAAVETITRRGTALAVFENDAAFSSPSPTSGFAPAAYTPTQPSDWTPYAATEPGTHKDLEVPDVGGRVTGNQSTYFWSVIRNSGPTGNPDTWLYELKIRRSDGVETTVASFTANNEITDFADWDLGLEYNPAESTIWISYRGFISYNEVKQIKVSGSRAYVPALSSYTTRPVSAGCRLRYAVTPGALAVDYMLEYSSSAINVRAATTPYAIQFALEYRENLQFWTLRRVTFDGVVYFCCIQRKQLSGVERYEWRLIVWRESTRAVVLDTPIISPTDEDEFQPAEKAFGSIWYDSAGADDVYVGYIEFRIGGFYFYLTKAAADSIAYADFEDISCSAAIKKLAASASCIVNVDETKLGRFIGRNSIAAEYGTTSKTLADFFKQRKRLIWEWYRSSCEVTSTDPLTGESFTEEYGATGDTAYRLEVDAPYISTPAYAKAIAKNYVVFLDRTTGQLDVTVPEPDSGPVQLFRRVVIGSTAYRVFRVQTDFGAREQSLVLVQE